MGVISMKQLLEAGVHFGHQTRRWNPKMAEYIFAERNGIYIIDLQKTVKKVEEAYAAVADIVEKLKNAQSVVICSYSGLTVEQVTEIRKQCRENDAAYCVLKNRLVLRALNEVGITGLDDLLNGPNAFVFSMKDAVSGPKIINDYIEKNKLESLKITGGVLGTETLDVAAVKHLATLPSREVLLAKLLGCMTNTVASFVRVVDAIRKQKNGEE